MSDIETPEDFAERHILRTHLIASGVAERDALIRADERATLQAELRAAQERAEKAEQALELVQKAPDDDAVLLPKLKTAEGFGTVISAKMRPNLVIPDDAVSDAPDTRDAVMWRQKYEIARMALLSIRGQSGVPKFVQEQCLAALIQSADIKASPTPDAERAAGVGACALNYHAHRLNEGHTCEHWSNFETAISATDAARDGS